ncbi:phosphopantetheine-binding protein [Streptomyces sp. CT34]|uniref:acyl carrier protein n=1 Tax=Streptomyces sp. CT34 TaxID=1553907 RepID=UPI0005BD317D|nr:phosphopantetheine-binding protein [Streptomyces sp. CT34]
MDTTLYDHLAHCLTTKFRVDPAAVRPQATFDSLDLDSLARLEFLLTLEDDFHVDIDEEEAAAVTTVAAAVDLLERKRAPAP